MKLRVVTRGHAGEILDLATFLKEHLGKAMKKGGNFCSFEVQLGVDAAIREALGTVRLVAFRIPEEKALEKIAHARKEAKRNGRSFTKAEEALCRYQICITNLPQTAYSDEEVIAFYRLRWQVELRFKSWKSRLKVGKQPIKQQKNRLLCQLWGFLLYQLVFVTMAEILKREVEQKVNGEVAATPNSVGKGKGMATPVELSHAKCIQLLATNHQKLVDAFACSPQQFAALLLKLFEQAGMKLKLEKRKPPKVISQEQKEQKAKEQKNKSRPKMWANRTNNYKIGRTKSSRKVKKTI